MKFRTASFASSIAAAVVVAIAVVAVVFGSSAVPVAEARDLVFALEVFRHGDRSPTIFAPACSDNVWPDGIGELTPLGMQQEYELGQFVRDRYVNTLHLFGPDYNYEEIYVRSTDVNRTLMSAQAQLYGIFQGTGPLPGGFQPVPIHSDDAHADTLLREFEYSVCPNYLKLLTDTILKQPDVVAFSAANADFFSAVQQMSGYKNNLTLQNWWTVYDPMYAAAHHNQSCPPGVNQTVFDRISSIEDYAFQVEFANPLARQMISGVLVRDIRDHLWTAVNASAARWNRHRSSGSDADDDDTPLRFVMYSAHDTTVASLLGGLGLFDGKAPMYAAHVFFELWNVSTNASLPPQFNVTIIYNNKTLAEFRFSDFLTFVAPEIPDDWAKLCGYNPVIKSTGVSDRTVIAVGISFGVFSVIMIGIAAYFYRRRKIQQGFSTLHLQDSNRAGNRHSAGGGRFADEHEDDEEPDVEGFRPAFDDDDNLRK